MYREINTRNKQINKLEREKNSLLEIMNCLKPAQSVLRCHAQAGFMPLKVKELLTKLRRDGLDRCFLFASNLFVHHMFRIFGYVNCATGRVQRITMDGFN
jgi:hypothetical protein